VKIAIVFPGSTSISALHPYERLVSKRTKDPARNIDVHRPAVKGGTRDEALESVSS
jgi:hypothetical protein